MKTIVACKKQLILYLLFLNCYKFKFSQKNQPLVSVPDLAQEIAGLKASVKLKHTKRKSINLRVLEDDLQKIKAKAIKEGIPYQTLIGSILHKFAQEPLH